MSVQVIRFAPGLKPVLKHQEHDQSTHGSWADSGSPKLTIMGKNDGTNEFFNENTRVVRYQPEGKAAVDYVLVVDDLFSNSSVVAYLRPTDGTTIDGNPESGFGNYKQKPVGVLEATGAGKNPWRESAKDDNKGTVVSLVVNVSHRRRGLASAMLKFHRDTYPELDIQHSHALTEDGEAFATVVKHGTGDQKPHGSWAHNGNGLGIEEVMRLHKSSDPLQSKVYEAEQSIDKTLANPLEKPAYPKRDDFPSRGDYDKAYKEYNKKWMDWAVEAQASILSDTGKKFLDGTPAGVKKYVEEVIKQDWFTEKFGDGSSLPKLDVKTSNTNAAGRHILKMQKDRTTGRIIKTVHEISLDRQSVKNERTILHEVSHYATAISQTEPFSSHGFEFAENHVYIVRQQAGSARAEALTSAYTEKGVQVGN